MVMEDYASASSATLVAVSKEIEKDFPARSHVNEVLEMLRLLCEGHNNKMQDLMHVQQGSGFESADLVSEVYELLAKLEPEIDEMNIEQMQACERACESAFASSHMRECTCESARERLPF